MSNSRESLLQKGHIENLTEDHKAWSKENSKDIVLTKYQARQVCLKIAKIVMSKREWQVYSLHIGERKTFAEIAEELDLTKHNVKVIKQRANNKIKQVVAESGLESFLK